jgi:hypothetical protein
MKYKITTNNIEIELTEEQVNDLIRQKEGKGEKFFFPDGGEKFYALDWYDVSTTIKNSPLDEDIIARGAYRTIEQAKKEDEKRLALVRMWKWVQENGLYFEPNWESQHQSNYYPVYNYSNHCWGVTRGVWIRYNFLFPYFKTSSDCQKFIDNNLSDLNLFV